MSPSGPPGGGPGGGGNLLSLRWAALSQLAPAAEVSPLYPAGIGLLARPGLARARTGCSGPGLLAAAVSVVPIEVRLTQDRTRSLRQFVRA